MDSHSLPAPDGPVPDGFARHFRQSPVTDPWEPLWSRTDNDRFILALRVKGAHCNSRGLLHGGVISALADNAMGLSCVLAGGKNFSLVTVNLSLDFLGMAATGAWLEFVATPTKIGKSLCFASVDVFSDNKMIARGTGVFHVVTQ
jgi:uncharacterized protein (TIGR00369 family)